MQGHAATNARSSWIAPALLALVLIGGLALGAARQVAADADAAGTTAVGFLTLGTGARTLAMGGASIGFGTDLGALGWNPAALGWSSRTEMVLSHAGLQNESLQEWAAVGGRFGRSHTRWSLSGLYQGDGSIEGRDAFNNPTGELGISSFAVGAHVAQQIGGRVTVGFGAKSVHENLGTVTGSGVTFDGGVMVRAGSFGFGVSGTNVLGQMKYDDAVFQFPTNYGVGASYIHPSGLGLAIDANFPNAYDGDVRAGLEWQWKNMLALRTGYRHQMGDAEDDLSGPSFGVGAGTNGMWLDYGYLLSANGEGQHRLGLRLSPNSFHGFDTDPFDQADTPPTDDQRSAPKAAKPAEKPATKATETKPAAPAATGAAAAPKTTSSTTTRQEPAATKAVPEAQKPVVTEQAPAKPQVRNEASPEPRPKKVTVKKGDTLASIARRYGLNAAAIMMENNLVSEKIHVGQSLKLPPER